MSLAEAVGQVAPLYNLGFVVLVVILFICLFRTRRGPKVFVFPWYLLFGGVLIFILEELFTVFRSIGIISLPVHVNGFFELAIIILFMYAVLLQKEHVREVHTSPTMPKKRKAPARKSARKSTKRNPVKKRKTKRR